LSSAAIWASTAALRSFDAEPDGLDLVHLDVIAGVPVGAQVEVDDHVVQHVGDRGGDGLQPDRFLGQPINSSGDDTDRDLDQG
jgi:hypothetical protein